MSSVWLCLPSARPPAEVEPVLAKWRERGYKIALWRDEAPTSAFADWDHAYDYLIAGRPYPGYAQAVNALVADVLDRDPSCDWIVTGGDDTLPDPNHTADEIAIECMRHFYKNEAVSAEERLRTQTFGVMQPTGDRFAGGSIDRIAGSPWMGREWCLRANQGKGPLWPDYAHCFADEELQNVAIKLGVFWQRPDLVHLHKHFMRESDDINSPAVSRPMPAHLVEAFSQAHWDKYQALFQRRKAAGFPGHEPLSSETVHPRIEPCLRCNYQPAALTKHPDSGRWRCPDCGRESSVPSGLFNFMDEQQ